MVKVPAARCLVWIGRRWGERAGPTPRLGSPIFFWARPAGKSSPPGGFPLGISALPSLDWSTPCGGKRVINSFKRKKKSPTRESLSRTNAADDERSRLSDCFWVVAPASKRHILNVTGATNAPHHSATNQQATKHAKMRKRQGERTRSCCALLLEYPSDAAAPRAPWLPAHVHRTTHAPAVVQAAGSSTMAAEGQAARTVV